MLQEKIFGRNLTEDDKIDAEKFVSQKHQEGLKPLNGELIKTPQEEQGINTAREYLNSELENLRLDKIPLPSESVHLLSHETFIKNFPEMEKIYCHAFIKTLDRAIYIDKSAYENNWFEFMTSILHEITHSLSAKNYWVDETDKSVHVIQDGYESTNPSQGENHIHFRGLNEAIIDQIVYNILDAHSKEIVEEFHLPEQELKSKAKVLCHYPEEVKILNTIIDIMSAKTKENREVVWQKFEKGVFTNEIMHLRQIEKIFGKGALRILASMHSDNLDKDIFERSAENRKILEYFTTNSKIKKKYLAQRVLNKREKLAYKKR